MEGWTKLGIELQRAPLKKLCWLFIGQYPACRAVSKDISTSWSGSLHHEVFAVIYLLYYCLLKNHSEIHSFSENFNSLQEWVSFLIEIIVKCLSIIHFQFQAKILCCTGIDSSVHSSWSWRESWLMGCSWRVSTDLTSNWCCWKTIHPRPMKFAHKKLS